MQIEPLYFGCNRTPGHNVWKRGMQYSGRSELKNWFAYKDTVFAPWGKEIEGRANLFHMNGYATILAFWDRSVDSRGQSNSAFLLPGVLDFDEAVLKAKIYFPEVFKRFKFEIVKNF